MNKNIVICSDGTGNTAIKDRGTNVFKLYEAVDLIGHRGNPTVTRQVAFYDDGVGTEGLKLLRWLGGAFGWGLGRNVRQLYAELARVYEPGDRIFLFGFSRGAFTVRTLAGFIICCGILDRAKFRTNARLRQGVKQAYREYRRRYRTSLGSRLRRAHDPARADALHSRFAVVHPAYAPEGRVRIAFIGVWDTVDAVGLPIDHLADVLNQLYRFKFPDLRLSPQVDKACHAISIDDERHTFHPVMWDEEHEGQSDRIEQVWFAGVHANVGGGYPKQGMSLVSLNWMMTRAEQCGLRFSTVDREWWREHENVHDKLYNSRAGLSVYYRYKPRDIAGICRDHHAEPRIHFTAIGRVAQATDGYAPGNLPKNLRVVTTGPVPQDSRLAELAPTVRAALGQSLSLLDRVRGWVLAGRNAHYAFVALSGAALYLTLSEKIAQHGWSQALGILVTGDGLMQLGKALLLKPWLLVLIAGFYVVGWLVRKKLDRVFSGFWHGLASSLRAILAPPSAPVDTSRDKS